MPDDLPSSRPTAPAPDPVRRATGRTHDITAGRKKVRVEISKPADGDVYLVGDVALLEGKVYEDDVETGSPEWNATPGTIEGNALALDQPGEYEVRALWIGVQKSVTIRAVKPQVVKIVAEKDGSGELFQLYDADAGGEKPPVWEKDLDARTPKTYVPACLKMGSGLKLKVTLKAEAALANETKIDLAGVSKDISDQATPKSGESWANKPLTFRLAESARADGKGVKDWSSELELPCDRPLPYKVAKNLLDMKWSYRVKSKAKGYVAPDVPGDAWTSCDLTEPYVVYTVLGAPKIGNGQDYDARSFSLKQQEFDHHHVDKACSWADGAWNLKVEHAWSIPYKIDNRFGHYEWPGDYELMKPKRTARPANYSKLSSHPDGLYYSSGSCCSNCGGTIRGGDCDTCNRRISSEVVCSNCKKSFNSSESFQGGFNECETDSAGIARWKNGSYECPNCSATAAFVAGTCRNPQCRATIYKALVKCIGCNQHIEEKDILSGAHSCSVETALAVDEQDARNGENWGWKVLDNETNPGGRCNQQASCIAAVLNTLGVEAKCRYIKAQKYGALNTNKDDPTTRFDRLQKSPPCFNGKSDWGWNFHGICGVKPNQAPAGECETDEVCFDGSFSSPYTGSWPPPEGAGRKHGTAKDAVTSSHDKKKWADGAHQGSCRCGHPMDAADRECKQCGAQPKRGYKCWKCNAAITSSWSSSCSSCREKLKGTYGESIVYLHVRSSSGQNCLATVHEADTECWRCGSALTPRDLTQEWTW